MSTLHQNPGPRMDAPPPGCGQPSLFGRWQRKGGEQSGKSQGPDLAQILNVAPQAGLSRILPLPSGRKSFPTEKRTRWG